MAKRKFSHEEVAQIYEESGFDRRVTAKKTGLSITHVSRMIGEFRKMNGLKQRDPETPRSGVSDLDLIRARDAFESDPNDIAKATGLSVSQVNRRLRRIRLAGGTSQRPTIFEQDTENPTIENRVDGARRRAGIPLDAIARVTGGYTSEYGQGIKNKDGEWEEHGLYSTRFKWTVDTPEFPLIQQAETHHITYIEAPRILRKVHQGLVISDAQIGYLRGVLDGLLDTIHDPRALELARQIIAVIAPEFLGFIGDWIDFSWVSRWTKRPEFFGIAQPSIQAGYEWKARFVAAAPQTCRKMEIGSNHQIRPDNFILEYNRESSGLTRARRPGDKGPEWHVFSEQFLCHYDELGIEFSGQWPGGAFFVLDDLALMHAPPKAHEFDSSVIHGHTHKLGNAKTHVIHGKDGIRREHATWDTGCLCRTDATTDKRRLMATSVPSNQPRTDWRQGIIHFEWMEFGGSTKHQVHPIHIFDGAALYQGQAFEVPETFEEGIVSTYGYEQVQKMGVPV